MLGMVIAEKSTTVTRRRKSVAVTSGRSGPLGLTSVHCDSAPRIQGESPMRLRPTSILSAMVFAVAFTWLLSGMPSKASAADATGTWKWSRTNQNGDKIDISLKLKQEGDKLSGTISGPGGSETEIKDGKVKDGEISFSVTRDFGGTTVVQKFAGKQDGDSIKGKIEVERDGEKMTRDWEAKRGA
jgi:hypothetical protein